LFLCQEERIYECRTSNPKGLLNRNLSKAQSRFCKIIGIERCKLISFYDLGEWEFYDLKEDPSEMNNLYNDPAYQEKIVELKKELARLRTQY